MKFATEPAVRTPQKFWTRFVFSGALLAALSLAPVATAAEKIKIGLLKIGTTSFVYLAQKKGYFAAEGLDAELVYMGAGQAISVAVVSGDIDFGVSAISAGFYNLAGQGAIKIIGGYAREERGFPSTAWVVSTKAHTDGLRSFKDLAGRSVAVSAVGAAAHYEIGLLADKYDVNLKTIRVLPMQTHANAATAVIGGQADVGVIPGSFISSAMEKGSVKLLGFVSDETPHELGVAYTNTRTANDRRDVVERFLRAYRKAAREYYDAFTGPDGQRKDGPTAPAVLALAAEHVGQPAEVISLTLGYVDRDARVDTQDLLNQIRWFKEQGMVKAEVNGNDLIDRRYVVELPKR